MIKKQKIQGTLFLFLLVFLGYVREYVFVSVNLKIQQVYYKSNENIHLIPLWTKRLNSFSYTELLNLKWILTFVFILLFWLIGFTLFKTFKFDKNQIKLYSIALIGLMIVSLLFYFVGDAIFNKVHIGYHIARNITGFLQSPLPILICFALFYSIKTKQIKN